MPAVLHNLQVVLVRPRFPENIGAAARVVANMGLGGLRVVAPERLWPEPMRRLASRHGRPVLERMLVVESLEEALADCVAAAATTARVGRNRGRLATPRRAAGRLLGWAAQGPVGLVFGPEDRGLTTGELDACFISICIPTSAEASLNLAQAVMVMAYELRCAALDIQATPAGTGRDTPPRPASMAEMHGLHQHLKEALVALGTLRADNPDHFYRPFKAVLERAGLSSREVRAWRGLARQALWLRGQLRDRS